MFNDMNGFLCRLFALTSLYILLALIYVALLRSVRNKHRYRFYFCDGSTRKIISVEIVSFKQYKHYDQMYTYPVMHISDNAIYFNVG